MSKEASIIQLINGDKKVFGALKTLFSVLNITVISEADPAARRVQIKEEKGFGGFEIRGGEEDAQIVYDGLPSLWRGFFEFAFTARKRGEAVFDNLTAMVDCSRNAVLSVAAVKKFIEYSAILGYTGIMLYTEDTYTVENRPYFGYLRGRYSIAEIKEIDAYAQRFGIEVIPCIQTLAHLNGIFRYGFFEEIHDIDDVVLCDDEKTYDFFNDVFSSLRKAFSSKKVHLGMDEAPHMTLGNYQKKHIGDNRQTVYLRHLKKVVSIAKAYGFECMIWGDTAAELNAVNLPESLEIIYWDYYFDNKPHYDEKFAEFKKLSNRLIFAGGAYKWVGFAPANRQSFANSLPALESAVENGVKHVILTMWGDDGSESSAFSVMPIMCLFADRRFSFFDDNGELTINALTRLSLSQWLTLDSPNMLSDDGIFRLNNAAKYIFYQDILVGLFDGIINDNYPEKFAAHAEKLKEISLKSVGFGYVFASLGALCDVLSEKCLLGKNLRLLYKAGDKHGLLSCAQAIDGVVQKIIDFYEKYSVQWSKENKFSGFEVQQHRFGGLIFRLKNVKNELIAYVKGQIPSIELLDVEILPIRTDHYGENANDMLFNEYSKIITANRN